MVNYYPLNRLVVSFFCLLCIGYILALSIINVSKDKDPFAMLMYSFQLNITESSKLMIT